MNKKIDYNTAYSKAFKNYLKYNIHITEPYYIKKNNIPNLYIWRTIGDEKVRISHQENNGKIFTRSNPPKTGHPGSDYNCRCIAEPYINGVSEYVNQEITCQINEATYKWTDFDFVWHFAFGGGVNLTLSETGHLHQVINHYFYKLGVMNRINKQIVERARRMRYSGIFDYNFRKDYSFKEVLWCFGGSIVSGNFNGIVKAHGDMLNINGTILYHYNDLFTDPTSVREKLTHGTSDPTVTNELWRFITDVGGSLFSITDSWETIFKAEIKVDGTESLYTWDLAEAK